jgi:hypothetical protein
LPGQVKGLLRELAGLGELADEVQPQSFPGVDLQVETRAETATAPGDDQDLDCLVAGEPPRMAMASSRSAIDSAFFFSGRLSTMTAMPLSSGPLASTGGGPVEKSVTALLYHRQ